MTLQEARTLHAFTSWATQRIFDALENVPADLLTKDLKSSHRNIFGTLMHLVGSERTWLTRLVGEEAAPGLIPADVPDLAALKAVWEKTGFATAKWLGSMSDSRLAGTISMTIADGTTYTHTCAQALQHLVDHGTYHRGQIITLLRQLGIAPPSTSLIRFYRETGKAR